MTSATQALIEEARAWPDECADAFEQGHWDADECVYYTPDECAGCDAAKLIGRLATALESSEAARRDLIDKIEALAAKWHDMAGSARGKCGSAGCAACAYWRCYQALRGLVSGEKKERTPRKRLGDNSGTAPTLIEQAESTPEGKQAMAQARAWLRENIEERTDG